MITYLAPLNADSPDVRVVSVDVTGPVASTTGGKQYICHLPKGTVILNLRTVMITVGLGTGTQGAAILSDASSAITYITTIDLKGAAGAAVDLDTGSTGSGAPGLARTPVAEDCSLYITCTTTSTVTTRGVIRLILELHRPSMEN